LELEVSADRSPVITTCERTSDLNRYLALQTLTTEEQEDKKDINHRLVKTNALPLWKTNFDKLCKWPDAKPLTSRSSKWLWHQKGPGTQGLQSKADFEALHSTKEWRKQWNSKKTGGYYRHRVARQSCQAQEVDEG